jgi:hypothetical protein
MKIGSAWIADGIVQSGLLQDLEAGYIPDMEMDAIAGEIIYRRLERILVDRI